MKYYQCLNYDLSSWVWSKTKKRRNFEDPKNKKFKLNILPIPRSLLLIPSLESHEILVLREYQRLGDQFHFRRESNSVKIVLIFMINNN